MAPKTDRAYQCPHCPVVYTTAVNLRAHQLAKHGLPTETTLANATTEELLAELEARMVDWPQRAGAARAFIRGCAQGLHKAAESVPEVADALNAVRR